MGRRLTESFKLQMKGVRKKAKKDRQEKQVPTFKNLGLEYKQIEDKNIEIMVSDILSNTEKDLKSLVLRVVPMGSTYIVDCIRCPICNKPVDLDRRWEGFVCQKCETHEKKIYEILNVVQ